MRGLLIVISGFSGVGKGTIVKELLKRHPRTYVLSVSATTRAPRPGEKEGREYFFKTREEFKELISSGALLEHAVYNGNCYGTPKQYVLDQLEKGKNVILEIEVQGGSQIKRAFPEAQLLFIVPPSAKELYNRLVKRGTETRDEVLRRMKRSLEETEYMVRYDFVKENDDLDRCVNEIHVLFDREKKIMNTRANTAARLKNELETIIREEG